MKNLIFTLSSLFFVISQSHSQCYEKKNLDNIVIMSSTEEAFIGAYGEKYNDSLFVSIKKIIDVDETRYSVFFFIKSTRIEKFVEYSILMPNSADPVSIEFGEKKFKQPIKLGEKYLLSASGNITESQLKRLLFADDFSLVAFNDSYNSKTLEYHNWKKTYRKCLGL